MGLALLYAYRSQTPAVQSVPITQAVDEVNAGKVNKVTVVGNKATLELKDTSKQQTTLDANQDTVLAPAITDYNKQNPTNKVALDYQTESATFSVIGSILLSLLPVLLIGGFFFYMMRQAQGTNNQALSFG
ncbi:MAG TPA: ATP-dependent metallopeptidase FtsH/Yme1/Tma family protein, partial [Candidatus Limnocylindria bacterium]